MIVEMMDYILIAASYLAGSIPFGLVIFYIVKKDDIRSHGSGNIGATNVLRNAGVVPGIVCFIMDFLKGFLPGLLALTVFKVPFASWTMALIVIATIVGHMYPVWLKFKGGKGVATAVGVFYALNWIVATVALVSFIFAIIKSKIVSLSSLIAAATFVLLLLTIDLFTTIIVPYQLKIAGCVAGMLIYLRHWDNIKRLLKGEEKKISSGKKKAE